MDKKSAGLVLGMLMGLWMSGSRCEALEVSLTVPGTAAIWLAGQPDGTCLSTCGPFDDVAPTNSPVAVDLAQFSGLPALSFSASGVTARDPNPGYPLEGPEGETWSNPGGYIGRLKVSGITAQTMSLIGVFLDSTTTLPVPEALDFSPPNLTAFQMLAPMIQQVFFIGDGLTGTGSGIVQRFVIPSGADQLFLGLLDVQNVNNVGALSVTVRATQDDSGHIISAPATLVLIGAGFLSYLGLGYSRRGLKSWKARFLAALNPSYGPDSQKS